MAKIIVQLKGGLGNQMFQYAFGRSLANRFDADLYLDNTHFLSIRAGETPRSYELGEFSHIGDRGLPLFWNKILKSSSNRSNKLKHRIIRKCFPVERIVEEPFGLIPTIIYKKNNYYYLDGYWQSEKYFLNESEVVRRDFSYPLSNEVRLAAFKMLNPEKNSVAVHVRRGDYVNDAKTNSFHGACDKSYFDKAMKIVREKYGQCKFYIFSDDPEWCRIAFGSRSDCNIVDLGELGRPHIDMMLMSICSHNIISNSSFSWWAAWLNNNEKKVVLAPEQWFADKSLCQKNITPSSWIKI